VTLILSEILNLTVASAMEDGTQIFEINSKFTHEFLEDSTLHGGCHGDTKAFRFDCEVNDAKLWDVDFNFHT
jgi:hypothetical protein